MAFKGLARYLSPKAPLSMTPAARSQLAQRLLAQSQSSDGIVSPYGTLNKALQGFMEGRANAQDRKAAQLTEGRQSALAGALSRATSASDPSLAGDDLRMAEAKKEAGRRASIMIAGGLPDDPLAKTLLAHQASTAFGSGEPYTLGQGDVRYGANNQQVASNPKPATDLANLPSMVNEITDDLYKESQTFSVQLSNIGNIRASLADASPAGDMGLVYSYMKMLDPTSAVREAEYATAENARGVPATVRNLWNRLQNGERLDEDQRKDFSNRAERYFAQERANQSRRNDRFLARATGAGVPKEMFSQYLLPLDPSQIAQGGQNPSAPPGPQPSPVPIGPPRRVIQ
jgi:hypothetical protein